MDNISGCCIALLLVAALLPLAAYADQPPTVISGSITIDGADAPAGTVVRAVVDGTERATYTVNVGGTYALVMTVDATDTGKSILFLVDGNQVQQTLAVPTLPSDPIELDLSVTTTATDVPGETEPPASAPAPASADSPTQTKQQHQQPIVFSGRLTYQNTTVVPAGAEVCVHIDGELRGSKTTASNGQYGIPPDDFNPLAVTGDSTDNGRNITFTVDGVQACEYHITNWVVDALNSPHTLNLIVGLGSDALEMTTDPGTTMGLGSTGVRKAAAGGGGKTSTGGAAMAPGAGALLAVAGLLVASLVRRRMA